ncbi:MAG: DUF1501 domain-containing protein [Bacteroidota bacterium]
MDRRNFLRSAGTLSLPLLGGLRGVQAAGSSLLTSLLPPNSDKVLVLIQLAGGNDGLNTLIPIDQMGAYQSVRANVAQPQSSLRAITNSLAMHSRMEGMEQLFKDERLSIIQSVGYPNQNRSHFRSTDIWSTASDATTELDTGWLGRHLEVNFPGYPEGYPSDDSPHPPAISMGSTANATCQGLITNMSQTVQNPFNLTYLAPGGETPLPEDNYGDELGFLRVAIAQTNAYGSYIQDAANNGNTIATYPNNHLANQLKNVARMISGGLQTQVYVVRQGGYDTHAGQVSGGTTNGQHAGLLDDLSQSIAAFQADLDALDLADRVLGMTFSEFGRRIRSNNSNGTDHGDAAPMFLFGNCATGTILGDNPTIDTGVDQNTGVPMQYDFRDVYGSVLVDWFEVPEASVRSLLYPGFVYLPVADSCAAVLPVELLDFTATGAEKTIDLRWRTSKEVDNIGFDVERSLDGRTFISIARVPAATPGPDGVREYELRDFDVETGPLYYYRLRQEDVDGSFTHSPIRTARLRGSAVGEWSFGHAFPNPASEETVVQVYAPQDGRVNYSLFSSDGRRLFTDGTVVYGRRDNQLTIRLGRVPAGTYTLRFTAGNGEYTTRSLIVR